MIWNWGAEHEGQETIPGLPNTWHAYDVRRPQSYWDQRAVPEVSERKPPKFRNVELPFHRDEPGIVPQDEALHHLRLNNPHLNDYQFSRNSHEEHEINVTHKPTGEHAGNLTWERHRDPYEADNDHYRTYKDGEIHMIEVEKAHQGKGIATAMWDYAAWHPDFWDQHPVHSTTRTMEGMPWSKYVGGPEYKRGLDD